jgi:hypothetical protein
MYLIKKLFSNDVNAMSLPRGGKSPAVAAVAP